MRGYKVTENGVEKIKLANKPLVGANVYYASKLSSQKQYYNSLAENYVIDYGVLTWANPNLYLQSSGTQYIDSNEIANTNTGVEVKCTIPPNNSTDNIVLGSRKDSGNSRYWVDLDWSNVGKVLFGYNNYSSDTFSSLGLQTGNKYVFSFNFKNDRKCIANSVICKELGNEALSEQTRSIYIFKPNYPNLSAPYYGKIYSVKISQGNNIVKHLVPVPNGLLIGGFNCPSNGMFDIVNQQFYANAGTGSFIFGKD